MKSSETLTVHCDYRIPDNQITINPNDGYDLGLMTMEYTISIFTNSNIEEFKKGAGNSTSGKIVLENECKSGTVVISNNHWKKMEMPKNVKLHYVDDKVLIENST